MAREVKRFELKAVDEELEKSRPVVRLENEETQQQEKPVRLVVEVDETSVSQRLVLPDLEIANLRTHQPGVEMLIDVDSGITDVLEQNWGGESAARENLPWGWFVLIGLVLAGGVIWSLTRVKESEEGAERIKISTEIVVNTDEQDEKEAAELIERIELTIRDFFRKSSVEGLNQLVRHPDRVGPIMTDYYRSKPITTSQRTAIQLLQPVTLDNHGSFWMASVVLESGEKASLLIEILDSGEVRIDWETLVCHQPIPWDTFTTERPAGASLDFRVYVEIDHFFSHEFTNSNLWACFRLSALDSEKSLFGYAPAGGEVATMIQQLLQQNASHRASLILRLSIPEGLQSRSGVMIEKVLSPRWLYIESPGADF